MNFKDQKKAILDHLCRFTYSHNITFEPCPAYPVQRDEIEQRLRTIEFQMNKKYLKNNFRKFTAENKFFFVVFQQRHDQTKHYHTVMHTPELRNFRKEYIDRSDFRNKFIENEIEFSFRKFNYDMKRKMRLNKNLEYIDTPPPIHITKIKNIEATIQYNAREHRPTIIEEKNIKISLHTNDDFFFPTPPNKSSSYDYTFAPKEIIKNKIAA